MFGDDRNLIVVYKGVDGEVAVNYLKKLVVQRKKYKSNERIGTEAETEAEDFKIVSWDEKVWLDNKKKGTVDDKILFIGDIKGTQELAPVIDVKFNKYGILYGFAGDQAWLTTNVDALGDIKTYSDFKKELSLGENAPKEIDTYSGAKSIAGYAALLAGGFVAVTTGIGPIALALGLGGGGSMFKKLSDLTAKDNIARTQLLYGVFQFFVRDLYSFME